MQNSDDFSVDTIASYNQWDCSGATVAGGVLNSPTAIGPGTVGAVVWGTISSGTSQYCRFDLTDQGTTDLRHGIIFRHDGADNGNCYWLRWNENRSVATVESITSGTWAAEQALTGTLAVWNTVAVVGATISGTGASTVISIWQDPVGTANDPSTWGVADATVTYNQGFYHDSAGYVGVGFNATSARDFDDLYVGDYTSATTLPVFMNYYRQMRG